MTQHPYAKLPSEAFWRSAISERHFAETTALWDPMPLDRSDRVATAGSCFVSARRTRLDDGRVVQVVA